MKIIVNKQDLLDKISLAATFTSDKLSTAPILQGIYCKSENKKLHFYTSNLNAFFHTSLQIEIEKKTTFVIEPKKIIEFINLLPSGKITLEIEEKQLHVICDKTKGSFPLISASDFPLPPTIEAKGQKIKTDFFKKNLPLVLYAASSDQARPVLTGVNFVTEEDDLIMVATDGFRLSLIKTKKEIDLPPSIIPSNFLAEVLRYIKDEKEISFYYLDKEKVVVFVSGETEFFSRLIEGEFPPYEKVIPQEKKTTSEVDTESLLRNVKLVSIFARDFSNIVVLAFKKDGLWCRPKMEKAEENSAYLESVLKGEEQRVAFNYKYVLDFLNHSSAKTTIIDVLRPDAPAVFRQVDNPNFLHIIMPVRIQE